MNLPVFTIARSILIYQEKLYLNVYWTKLVIKLQIRFKSRWPDDKTSPEGCSIDYWTSMHGLQQLISEPNNLLVDSLSCFDLIFIDQPNLTVDSGVYTSLCPTSHHQTI